MPRAWMPNGLCPGCVEANDEPTSNTWHGLEVTPLGMTVANALKNFRSAMGLREGAARADELEAVGVDVDYLLATDPTSAVYNPDAEDCIAEEGSADPDCPCSRCSKACDDAYEAQLRTFENRTCF